MDACEAALLLTKFIHANNESEEKDTEQVINTYQKCYFAIDNVLSENMSESY